MEKETEARISWSCWPLRSRPFAAAFVLLLVPAVGAGIYLESKNPVLSLFGIIFLLVAISPAIFTTKYTLTEEGITVKHLGKEIKKPWSYFRRVFFEEDLIFLSPYVRPRFVESFRGVYLRFDTSQKNLKAEVERYVLAHLKKEVPKGEKVGE